MYLTILKLLSPYLQRFAANKLAAYLRDRRERRLQAATDPLGPTENEMDLPDIAQIPKTSPPKVGLEQGLSSQGAIWYVLSGLVLGGALGIVLGQLMDRQR